MKKIPSLFAALLFAGSMMADPIVINASDVTTIASGATSGLDVTLQGINIVWQGAYYNSDGGDGGSASVDFRVYANKSMTLTAESNISKVEIAGYCKAGLTVTANAGTITTGASYASETTKGTLEDPLIVVDEIGATSVTLTCTKQMRAYTLRITLDGGVTPPAVATPVISGDETFTESVVVTITCSTPEADIYYTTDGTTNPTCDCPAAPEYTQQIVLTETTTIMAAAYTGNDWSAVATKTFTKVPPLEPITCAEVYDKAKNDKVALKDVTVTYTNGKNVYVKDATGAMLIYLPADAAWKAGDVLSGVKGVVDIYNKLYEVKPSADQVAAVTATPGEAPAPVELTAAPVAADMNKYVILNNVTVSAATFPSNKNMDATIGEETFVLRNNFNADVAFDTEKKYDITGVVAVYNDAVQLYFINAELSAQSAVDNIAVEARTVKAIRNGQVVLIRDGKVINMLGVEQK